MMQRYPLSLWSLTSNNLVITSTFTFKGNMLLVMATPNQATFPEVLC